MNVIFQNKMGVYRKLKALALAGLLGVIAFGSSNSFADGVNAYGTNFASIGGGIGAPSLPAFGTYINASFTKGKYSSKLVVTQKSSTSAFFTTWSPYAKLITSTAYNLTANFNKYGVFTSGTVTIKGKFGGTGTIQTLMKADLTAFGKSSDGKIWAFNTNNIVCSAAVNAAAHGCTTSEVVYLGLASAQKYLTKSWKTSGVALTSVPVPAAVWLLGSGLVGLVSIGRRKVELI